MYQKNNSPIEKPLDGSLNCCLSPSIHLTRPGGELVQTVQEMATLAQNHPRTFAKLLADRLKQALASGEPPQVSHPPTYPPKKRLKIRMNDQKGFFLGGGGSSCHCYNCPTQYWYPTKSYASSGN